MKNMYNLEVINFKLSYFVDFLTLRLDQRVQYILTINIFESVFEA